MLKSWWVYRLYDRLAAIASGVFLLSSTHICNRTVYQHDVLFVTKRQTLFSFYVAHNRPYSRRGHDGQKERLGLQIYRKFARQYVNLTRFNKSAIQGTPQMAVD